MKITRIRVREVRVPLLKSYTISRVGTLTHTAAVILELDTDQGLAGVGESDPALMFTGESQHTVMAVLRHHLGPAILGRNPLELEQMHGLMNAICVGNPFAKAAIDLACHDIAGKALNVPLYQLYGGLVSERIEVMWSLGSDTVEANVRRCRPARGRRLSHHRTETRHPRLETRRRPGAGRAQGGRRRRPDPLRRQPGLGAGRSHRGHPPPGGVRPLHDRAAGARLGPRGTWRRCKAAVNVPIAVDEGIHSPLDALRIVKADAADIFSIKTTKMGGLLPSWKTAAMIEAAGRKVFVNSMIELGVSVMSGLNFAVSNPTLFPVRPRPELGAPAAGRHPGRPVAV